MVAITVEQLKRLAPNGRADILRAVADGGAVLDSYGINTPLRICHFLAQVAHESAGFRTTKEYASGAAYEGRKNLGNTQPGDGKRYKGRGLIQLTGRANYRTYGKRLGIDLEGDPAQAEEPALSLQIACEYWKANNLNVLADKDDVAGITRKINGGYNGLDDRKKYLAKAKTMWGVPVVPKAPPVVKPSATPLQVQSDPDKAVMVEGYSKEVVESAQKTLASKGYDPGIIDGKYGSGTIGAISKAQAENGAPVTGKLDDATLALIASMPQRPISDARKAVTTETLREAKSTTVAAADKGSWWSKVTIWAGGLLTGGKVANDTGALDGVQTLLGQGQQVREVVTTGIDLGGWVQAAVLQFWPVAVLGAGIAAFFAFKKIKTVRTEAVRQGADVSG
jgi:putative chitinase